MWRISIFGGDDAGMVDEQKYDEEENDDGIMAMMLLL
jgi:hypothetical protein